MHSITNALNKLHDLCLKYRVVSWLELTSKYSARLSEITEDNEGHYHELLEEMRNRMFGRSFDSLEDLTISEANGHDIKYSERKKANAELENIRRTLRAILCTM